MGHTLARTNSKRQCSVWVGIGEGGPSHKLYVGVLTPHSTGRPRAHLFLKVPTGEGVVCLAASSKGYRGACDPYLGAGSPGHDSLDPFGAGSPSGRRWRQLGKRRGAGRLRWCHSAPVPTIPTSTKSIEARHPLVKTHPGRTNTSDRIHPLSSK